MKNKIAYICNTYIRNYGSILQSYALYVKLKQLGFEPDVVDYKDTPNSIQTQFKQTLFLRIPMLFKYSELKKKFLSIKAKKNEKYNEILHHRYHAMDVFVNENFSFTRHCDTINDVQKVINDYDSVFIGSDQLWGVAEILRDYHTLNFVPSNKPKISYATSFGVSQLPYFVRYKTSKFLKRIDMLSVREISGAKLIKDISGRTAEVVVDPTLLFTPQEWDSITCNRSKINRKYVFCFFLGNNPNQRNFAIEFSKKVDMPIVTMQHVEEYIPSDNDYADINVNDASPADFVSLIKDAEYIICDSFHASIFSIIFRKQFFTLNRYASSSSNSRNTRIFSLFSKLGITDRNIQANADIEKILHITTNYDEVHEKIKIWRNESLEYLKSTIKIINK